MSKLVENLAEELVEKLKEDGTLDLSDNEKFNEFTDLLYEILDNGVETEQRIIDTNDKMETVDKKTDDLNNNINGLAESIYNYFNKRDAGNNDSGNNVASSGVLSNIRNNVQAISVNQHRVLAIVEKLQSDMTAQGNDIKEIRKKLEEKPKDNTTTPTTNGTIPTDSSDDEKGSKHHVRTIHYLKSIRGSIRRSEHNLRQDNKRMERSIKNKIKSGFGKWWGRLKKILLVAAIFLFGPVIKRILGGIVEMTEPMWRPFTDWFTKNFPKLTEGIEWVMHAVGQILDFALTLKELYNEYLGTDEKKEEAAAAATMAESIATGAKVAGLPGALVGLITGGMLAELRQILNEEGRYEEGMQKYQQARKEYDEALKNPNLTSNERARLKMESAELDYLAEQAQLRYNIKTAGGVGRTFVPHEGMEQIMFKYSEDNSIYKRAYEDAKLHYERMQTNPELFDEDGNYKLDALTGGAFGGFANNLTFQKPNSDTGASPTIVSNNTFTTVEVTVRPEDSPLKPH